MGGLNVEINELRGASLDLHLPPELEDDLLKGRNVCYNTISVVEGTEDVEFHIPPDPECYFVLNQARLEGYFVVSDDDGGNVLPIHEVTLADDYAACLFSQVEIYLNGTQVCDLSAPVSYPYKHYIDTTLSYQFNTINGVCKAGGYYLSHRGKCCFNYENGVPNLLNCDDKNEWHQSILSGKKVYFSSTVPADILYMDKYLPPNVEITMKLKRFNTSFGIQQKVEDKTFHMVLKDVKLIMRKVLPSQRVRDRFRSRLLQRPCFLPYKDSQMKLHHVPQGTRYISVNHINSHLLPNQIIFVFVRSAFFTKDKSSLPPFAFKHNNLASVVLKKNGKPLMPRPMECDFDDGDYVELYEYFQSNVGTKNRITLDDYASYQTFLVFDLTPDKCNSFHNHPTSAGDLELDLTFSEPLSEDVTLLSYAFFNSGITIDKNLQVTKLKY